MFNEGGCVDLYIIHTCLLSCGVASAGWFHRNTEKHRCTLSANLVGGEKFLILTLRTISVGNRVGFCGLYVSPTSFDAG